MEKTIVTGVIGSDTHIVGSYYYDSRRSPLKLSGKLLPSGDIELCESDIRPGELPVKQAVEPHCAFALHATSNDLAGTWKNGTASLDVQLHQVGQLDNNAEERIEDRGDQEDRR